MLARRIHQGGKILITGAGTQGSSIKNFSLESSNFNHNAADPGTQPGAVFVSMFPLSVYPLTFELH